MWFVFLLLWPCFGANLYSLDLAETKKRTPVPVPVLCLSEEQENENWQVSFPASALDQLG